jgi:ParB-like chromosome segregation protein Spo0J
MARKKCKCGKALATQKGGLCRTCEKAALASGGAEQSRKVADLRPHPRNAGIYGDGPDEAFVDSVRRNGVLTALLVTPDGLIIAGHRRWEAARLVGRDDVPVIVMDGLDDDRVLELLVESNLQRARSNEQIGREADALWPIFEKRQGGDRRCKVCPA